MSVKDWASMDRWLIESSPTPPRWWVYQPAQEGGKGYATFSEAHAAYLDAVTCEAVTPFLSYSDSRCSRSRGHRGPHWFATPVGLMPLVVNQK